MFQYTQTPEGLVVPASSADLQNHSLAEAAAKELAKAAKSASPKPAKITKIKEGV